MGLADKIFEEEILYKKSLDFAKRLSNFNTTPVCHIKKIFRKEVYTISQKYKKEDQKIFDHCLSDPNVKDTFEKLAKKLS